MAYINLTQNGVTGAKTARMIMIEKTEKRRFSLSLLTGFLLVFLGAMAISSNPTAISPLMIENSFSWALRLAF